MLPDPNRGLPFYGGITFYNGITGVSGLEDTINSSSAAGVPDQVLEPVAYYPFSPEDVDGNGVLDRWGQKYLGAGFGLPSSPTNYMAQEYFPIPASAATSNANQISCSTYISGGSPTPLTVYSQAQNNMITGPRHSLRLVDGGMDGAGNSYLPHPATTTPPTYGDGFTVVSEEPVYVLGDYNSGSADPFFPSLGVNATTPHSAAGIIADAVTAALQPPVSSHNADRKRGLDGR